MSFLTVFTYFKMKRVLTCLLLFLYPLSEKCASQFLVFFLANKHNTATAYKMLSHKEMKPHAL